jgi:hypothetical protein
MSGTRLAARAATIIGGALVLSALVALGLNQINFLNLYTTGFAFEPGPWFAEHIAPSVGKPNYCLIVGPSTAREGFDTKILGKYLPELTFVNAATTGGNIEVAEVQAQILARYGINAKCIIVGLHPFLMMAETPPLLASTGYLAHLNFTDLFLLSDHAAVSQEFRQILETITLPLKAHADRINKLVRYWVFQIQERYRLNPLSLSAYEYFADEFKSGANAFYDGTHIKSEALAELIRMRYQTYTYDSPAPEVSFNRALTLFRKEAEHVYVVTMPNNNVLLGLNAKGKLKYDRAIEANGVTQIDCSDLVPNEYFIDDVHLDPEGRRLFSNAIGRILSKTEAALPDWVSCN